MDNEIEGKLTVVYDSDERETTALLPEDETRKLSLYSHEAREQEL